MLRSYKLIFMNNGVNQLFLAAPSREEGGDTRGLDIS